MHESRNMDVDPISPVRLARITGGFPGGGLIAKVRDLKKLWTVEPWTPPPGYKPLWQEALEAIGAYDEEIGKKVRAQKALMAKERPPL